MLIMFLGTFLVCATSVVWVLGAESWRSANRNDPRKILLQEVVTTLKARMNSFSRNGAGTGAKKETDLDRADDLQT
jgi:hypothetical protein